MCESLKFSLANFLAANAIDLIILLLLIILSKHKARSLALRGFESRPVKLGIIDSLQPVTFVVTTGLPHAAASIRTLGNPS